MTRAITARCATVVLAVTVTGATVAQQTHSLVPADQLKWGPERRPRSLPKHRSACSKGIPPRREPSRFGCVFRPTTSFDPTGTA